MQWCLLNSPVICVAICAVVSTNAMRSLSWSSFWRMHGRNSQEAEPRRRLTSFEGDGHEANRALCGDDKEMILFVLLWSLWIYCYILVFCGCSAEPIWDEILNKYVGGGPELGCQQLTNSPVIMGHITVKAYVERVILFKRDQIRVDFVVLSGYVIFFRVLGLLALRFINH